MPLRDLPVIAGGGFTARFAPEMGGRMVALHHIGAGDLLAPMDAEAAFDPLNWPRGGAYPLFPFHNRLPGARFDLGGDVVQLRANPNLGADLMHGPAHQRAWSAAGQGADWIELALDWVADADWPFDFRATQRFDLAAEGVAVGLVLTNQGAVPMPAGMGWHPYFALDQAAPARLVADLIWPAGAHGLPEAAAQSYRDASLPATTGWTDNFSDWQRAELEPAPGWVLEVTADAGLPHVAVHRMPRYLCIEPVSHCAGALSLPEGARAEAGLPMLAPGATIRATIHLSLRRQDNFPQE